MRCVPAFSCGDEGLPGGGGAEGAFGSLIRPGGGGMVPSSSSAGLVGTFGSDGERGGSGRTSVTVAAATVLPVGTTVVDVDGEEPVDDEAGRAPALVGPAVADDDEADPELDEALPIFEADGDEVDADVAGDAGAIGFRSSKWCRIDPIPPWPGAGGNAVVDQPLG